jgi:hypothetical protein
MTDQLSYLKELSKIYSSDNKSLTEVLNSFKCISDNYAQIDKKDFKYSSYDFDKCNIDEQNSFVSDQLQFIECLVANTIYDKTGLAWNWKEIYDLLHNEAYARMDKIKRKVVYATDQNSRPIGDVAYQMWNGLQIIDLDIKNESIAEFLKEVLFKELCKFNWFLGVCKSASGRGLHVWTKVTPISVSHKNRKIEYLCNFRHKYSYVYMVLLNYMDDNRYTKSDIIDFMDMAMAKPQQGIFISSDNKALMNTNFQDLRLDVNFEGAFDNGISSIDWISHTDLKEIFSKLEWFNNENFDNESNVDLSNINNINERDLSKRKGKKHYKHNQRWQLANTLTALYGEQKAFEILREICEHTSTRELKGDVKTASIHSKPISIWAVKELNKFHGFKIEVKGENEEYNKRLSKVIEEVKKDSKIDYVKSAIDNDNKVVFNITSKQFLGNIKDDIIKNLSKITLLEAGAGYGKTEMIKSLSAKTLLILPFTSTIKAKIEADENTSDWLYYYGSKRPTTQELMSDKSISMTIDKFSNINLFELNNAQFEYIVIDESHLLFTSSFRDVMSPTIQRLANCNAKVIMMTGTPTGELLFFPNIKHIKVIKEDIRVKDMKIFFTPTKVEQTIDICKHIAQDICDGKKILFPTNNGNLYFEQIIGLVQQYADEMGLKRKINAFYYKKSNTGEESMDSINFNKSVGANDIVFCSSFLSVGVDICDKYDFRVYFSELWISQDIEQFANRIRNNDLYIKLFLPKRGGDDYPINYLNVDPLDLGFNKEDLVLIRDFIRTCNDMLDRNDDEYRYNPLIQSILSANRYLKYDENDRKYYIDETAYKLKVFEERYTTYAKQLQVLIKAMANFGYTINEVNSDSEVSDERKIELEEYLKSCKNTRNNLMTSETFKFLRHITDDNIDEYRNIMKGNYEVFKSDNYSEEREKNNLYVENIEVLERNAPIVISLYKNFTLDVIHEIYDFCVDKKQNRINYTKLEKVRAFVSLENKRKQKKIDIPVLKFLQDTKVWVEEHPETSKDEIEVFQKTYAAKYANSVTNVVVEDVLYLEEIYGFVKELWNIIVVQSRPKNGIIKLEMFELLWETKNSLDLLNIYGDKQTQSFFADTLLQQMNETEIQEDEAPDLEHTAKLRFTDIEEQLPTIVHAPYDYFKYSDLDGSNNRFLRKQENTQQQMFVPNTEVQDAVNKTLEENNLLFDLD